MAKVPLGNGKSVILEDDFRVTKFRRYLPRDAVGGNRRKALVQFFATEGGMRTVAEGDLIEIK